MRAAAAVRLMRLQASGPARTNPRARQRQRHPQSHCSVPTHSLPRARSLHPRLTAQERGPRHDGPQQADASEDLLPQDLAFEARR